MLCDLFGWFCGHADQAAQAAPEISGDGLVLALALVLLGSALLLPPTRKG